MVLELKRDAFEALLLAASPFALRFQHQIATAGIRQLRTANQRLASVIGSRPSPDRSRPSLTPPSGLAAGTPPPRRRTPASASTRGLPPRVDNRPKPAEKQGLGARLKNTFSKIPTGSPIGGGGVEEPRSKGKKDLSEREQEEMLLAYMQAALGEWDMDMSDLDSVRSVRPAGVMSAAEKKNRGG